MEQTLRMLVSIQEGVFLEPLSQIVAKDLVGAVKMDLPADKMQAIADFDRLKQGDGVKKNGVSGDSFRVSLNTGNAMQLAGYERDSALRRAKRVCCRTTA